MLTEYKEKMDQYPHKYISIGITKTGEGYGNYPVPWDTTGNAYNMKIPDVYLAKEDLADEEIMSRLRELVVCGCYIYCPLEDYSFLEAFHGMMDLNIFEAYRLQDLSFLKKFKNCNLLFIAKAHLKNLDEIVVQRGVGYEARPQNLALYDCTVDSLDILETTDCWFHELIVYNPADRNERDRWKNIRKAKYYEICKK